MTDAKRLNTILGIVAILVLVLSFSAFAYSQIPKGDASLVVVNDIDYGWDAILTDFEIVDFTASGDEYQGVLVSEILLDAGLDNPQDHTYRFTGLDGYQKDLGWHDVQHGYLVEDEHKVVFPNQTRSFWVKNLASIEVVI